MSNGELKEEENMYQKTYIIFAIVLVLFFSGCEYKEKMSVNEENKLLELIFMYVNEEKNYSNFFKRCADSDMTYEEEVEMSGGIAKYQLLSNDIDRYFENGILYENDKVQNQKSKVHYQFANIPFVTDIQIELNKLKSIIRNEYISDVSGVILRNSSIKSLNVELKSIQLHKENLVTQEFLSITIFARFDLQNNLKSIGVIYLDLNENLSLYETGSQLRQNIQFNVDFNDFQ